MPRVAYRRLIWTTRLSTEGLSLVELKARIPIKLATTMTTGDVGRTLRLTVINLSLRYSNQVIILHFDSELELKICNVDKSLLETTDELRSNCSTELSDALMNIKLDWKR